MFKKVSSLAAIFTMALGILFLAVSCKEVATPAILSPECDILEFTIGSYTRALGSDTIVFSVPYGTDISSLTPTITVSEGASVSPASGTAIPFTDGVPVPFVVTAEDGKTTKTYKVTVNVTPASQNTSIVSTIGEVRLNVSKLVSIPAGTTLAELDAAVSVTPGTGATYGIFDDATGAAVATVLDATKVIIVTAQDGVTKQTYTLSILAPDRVVFTATNYGFDGEIASVVKNAAGAVPGYDNPAVVSPVVTIEGVITAKTSRSFTIQDSTAAIMIFASTAEGIGTRVSVNGVREVKNFYGQLEVTAFDNIDQVSVDNDLYYRVLTTDTVLNNLANQNQLFRYTGFATGALQGASNTKALALNTAGIAYQDAAGDAALTTTMTTYHGDFYGPIEISRDVNRIVVNSPAYFVASATAISITDITGTLRIRNPEVGETQLDIPSVPVGYTVAITASTNESVISLTGAVAIVSAATDVTLTLTVTKVADSSTATANITVTVPPLVRNATGGTSGDLFISEYVECSVGNDKAIELANFTGADVDLGNYQLVLFSNSNGLDLTNPANGGNSWRGSGILGNGAYHVNANAAATSFVFDSSSTVNYFNGNDTICLYVTADSGTTWTLIDVVGTNDGTNFAKDVTLVRRPGNGPSVNYNVADWYEFPANYFADLGNHVY